MKSLLLASSLFVAAFSAAQDSCCKKPEDKKTVAVQTAAASGEKKCCRSTPAKPVAYAAKGCCNEKGTAAKFKVFVAGEGYRFFGCAGSAKKGRAEIVAKGAKAGVVQPVSGRATI